VLKGADILFSIHPPAEAVLKGKILISVFGPLTNKPAVEKLAKEG
jgi:FPC/CPF motif-containing protein YcgG